ncbi:MAG: SUKH-3 domain-containing protein [Oscillospiraceae bacterium]|nr:SUKH-3 domain-containing protein [Oscillospiraceae bacterium]
MLNEIAKQQLKKAGWYDGRKIDITEQVKFLENLGYEVFDAAKKFMEEYGELDICDRFIGYKNSIGKSHNTTCIKDLFAHIPNREIEKYDLDEEVGQKTIPVVIFSDQVYIYLRMGGCTIIEG